MIAVIGGVKTKIEVKMKLPEAPKHTDWPEQVAGEQSQNDAFEAMQARMRAEHDRFWQGEQSGSNGMFGQLSMLDGDNDDIIVSSCGCALNVARNLADMGDEVELITVCGKDPLGLAAIADMRNHGIGIRNVKQTDGSTPVLLEIKNFSGEVEFARSNEAMFGELTPARIDEVAETLAKADAIMVDGSLPQETLHYIASRYGDSKKIFFDPASRAGGDKINGESEIGSVIMQKLFCVMPGRVEAEKMADMIILGPDKLQAAADLFADKGVDRIFIKIKAGGIFYRDKDGEECKSIRPERVLSFADTTGAGDVVSAVILHETMKGTGTDETAEVAMKAAAEFLSGLSDERPY